MELGNTGKLMSLRLIDVALLLLPIIDPNALLTTLSNMLIFFSPLKFFPIEIKLKKWEQIANYLSTPKKLENY
jgi:predicted Zn-dependent protease